MKNYQAQLVYSGNEIDVAATVAKFRESLILYVEDHLNFGEEILTHIDNLFDEHHNVPLDKVQVIAYVLLQMGVGVDEVSEVKSKINEYLEEVCGPEEEGNLFSLVKNKLRRY